MTDNGKGKEIVVTNSNLPIISSDSKKVSESPIIPDELQQDIQKIREDVKDIKEFEKEESTETIEFPEKIVEDSKKVVFPSELQQDIQKIREDVKDIKEFEKEESTETIEFPEKIVEDSKKVSEHTDKLTEVMNKTYQAHDVMRNKNRENQDNVHELHEKLIIPKENERHTDKAKDKELALNKDSTTVAPPNNKTARAGAILSMEAQGNVKYIREGIDALNADGKEIKGGVKSINTDVKDLSDNKALLQNMTNELFKVNKTLEAIAHANTQPSDVESGNADRDTPPSEMLDMMAMALHRNTLLTESNAQKLDALVEKMGVSTGQKGKDGKGGAASIESRRVKEKEDRKKDRDDLAKKIGCQFGNVIDNGLDKTMAAGFKGITKGLLTQTALIGMKVLPIAVIIGGVAFAVKNIADWLNIDLKPTIQKISKAVSGIPDVLKRVFKGIFEEEDKAFASATDYDENIRQEVGERIDMAREQGIEIPKHITQTAREVAGFEMAEKYVELANEQGKGEWKDLTKEQQEDFREKLARTGVIKPTTSTGAFGFGKGNEKEVEAYFNDVKSGSKSLKEENTTNLNETTKQYRAAKNNLGNLDKKIGYSGGWREGITGDAQQSQLKGETYTARRDNFLHDKEGNKRKAYVFDPEKYPESGVTLARGLDLGQGDRKRLENMGIAKYLIDEWEGYGWIGKKGKAANDAWKQNKGRELTTDELIHINRNAVEDHEKDAMRLVGSAVWSALTENQKIAITSMRYHGSLSKNKINAIKGGDFENAAKLHIMWGELPENKKKGFEKRSKEEAALLLSYSSNVALNKSGGIPDNSSIDDEGFLGMAIKGDPNDVGEEEEHAPENFSVFSSSEGKESTLEQTQHHDNRFNRDGTLKEGYEIPRITDEPSNVIPGSNTPDLLKQEETMQKNKKEATKKATEPNDGSQGSTAYYNTNAPVYNIANTYYSAEIGDKL